MHDVLCLESGTFNDLLPIGDQHVPILGLWQGLDREYGDQTRSPNGLAACNLITTLKLVATEPGGR